MHIIQSYKIHMKDAATIIKLKNKRIVSLRPNHGVMNNQSLVANLGPPCHTSNNVKINTSTDTYRPFGLAYNLSHLDIYVM